MRGLARGSRKVLRMRRGSQAAEIREVVRRGRMRLPIGEIRFRFADLDAHIARYLCYVPASEIDLDNLAKEIPQAGKNMVMSRQACTAVVGATFVCGPERDAQGPTRECQRSPRAYRALSVALCTARAHSTVLTHRTRVQVVGPQKPSAAKRDQNGIQAYSSRTALKCN